MKALKFSTKIAQKIAIGSMVLGLALPWNQATAAPADDIAALKQQLATMQQQMSQLQAQLKKIEAKPAAPATVSGATATTAEGGAMSNAALTEEVEYLNKRLSKAELHTTTDKLSFGVSLRSRGDSVQTKGYNNFGEEYTTNNSLLFTTRLRLDMKAKVSDKFDFAGRLTANKVWGDSLGVNYFDNTGSSVWVDGTSAALPHGDSVKLERAYFNYKGSLGKSSTNFSVGRRPGTEGMPLEHRNNSLVGGSPLATVINWQFDGISANFTLDEYTGVEGSAIKFCYGVGFEGDLMSDNQYSAMSHVKDVNFGGFIASLYDDDITNATLTFARAWDVTDNFTGTTVYATPPGGNPMHYISRTDPTVNMGTWDALSLLVQTNLEEKFDKDIDLFLNLTGSNTTPNGKKSAAAGGVGLLNDANSNFSRFGHSVYLGAIFPVFEKSKWGLEYNYGSRYWFNFSGAEDAVTDSKLAARGQVWETYFIQPIYKENFFVTIGGKYYNYKYTGSGSQLDTPQEVDDAQSGVDKVYDVYVSLDANF